MCQRGAMCSTHISTNKKATGGVRIGGGNLLNYCTKQCDKAAVNPVFDLLIGQSGRKHYEKDTWFQFEYAKINTVYNRLKHTLPTVRYMLSGKNQGPFGQSRYTEANPLIIYYINNTWQKVN